MGLFRQAGTCQPFGQSLAVLGTLVAVGGAQVGRAQARVDQPDHGKALAGLVDVAEEGMGCSVGNVPGQPVGHVRGGMADGVGRLLEAPGEQPGEGEIALGQGKIGRRSG